MALIADPLPASPATKAQISVFERYVGRKLPSDYRQFLLSSAGRLLILFTLLAGLMVAAVFAAMVRPRPSAITRDNEARIHKGMTVDKLEAIFGGSPRDESTGPTDFDPYVSLHVLGRPAHRR